MTIIIISLIALILIIYALRFLNRDAMSYGKDVQNSSFLACINPFDTTIRKIYNSLSPENKGSFWSVVSNTSVAILTFWIGLTVQYFILDSTKSEDSKLSHFQVVDKLKPMYENMNDSCTQHVFKVFYEALSYSNNNPKVQDLSQEEIIEMFNRGDFGNLEESAQTFLIKFFIDEKEWDNLVYAGEKCVATSSSIAPYLESEKGDKLLLNNSIILVGTNIYEALKDSIPFDSITFVRKTLNSLLTENVKGTIGNNTEYKSVSSLAYESYKNVLKYKTSNKNSKDYVIYKASMAQMFNTFFATPLLENTVIMRSEFSSPGRNNILIISFGILLLCLLIGYLIFRIIIIKFFNKNKLIPGENKLSKEIDNLRKIIAEKEKDLKNADVEINLLLSTNKHLLEDNEYLKMELAEIKAAKKND